MGNLQFAGNFDIHLSLDSIRLVSIPGLAAVLDQLVDILFFLYPCHVFFQMVMAGMLLLIANMLKWAFFGLFLLGFVMMVMIVLLFLLLLFSRSRKGLKHLQVLMEGFQRLQDIEITVSRFWVVYYSTTMPVTVAMTFGHWLFWEFLQLFKDSWVRTHLAGLLEMSLLCHQLYVDRTCVVQVLQYLVRWL